jgi:hypothetical protein
MDKKKILATILMLAGSAFASNSTAYPENNEIRNLLYVAYDFIVAVMAGFIPFIPAYIGIWVLLLVVGILSFSLLLILGLILTFGQHKKK